MCIQIFTHPICIVYMCVFFLFVATGIGRGKQTTDVISIKRRHPNMLPSEKKHGTSSYAFWGQKPFFFFYPKKHKNPLRQIFVSGLTLNGFFPNHRITVPHRDTFRV